MRTQVRLGPLALDRLSHGEVVDVVMTRLADGRGGLLITPNLDIARLMRRPDNVTIAQRAALAVCDGMPLLWASHLAGTPLPGRVTGSRLIYSLSRAAAESGRSVYLLGGPEGAAEAAAQRLADHAPGLVVSGWSCPPEGFEHDPDALAVVVADVVASRPDIVFVCLGFPKQEHLALRLTGELPGTWFLGCGAAVEFVAGTRRRAPLWMQRAGLEWAHRMSQEPRRLGPRYAKDAVFAIEVLARSTLAGLRAARRRTGAGEASSVIDLRGATAERPMVERPMAEGPGHPPAAASPNASSAGPSPSSR